MSTLKTLENDANVLEFINSVENETRKKDSLELLKIFKEATGLEPKMWGDSLIGYGKYHYKSERSKQEGDWPLTGFSPRNQSLTVYIMPGFESYTELLGKLGKFKTSVSCLYINKLSDIDINVLEQIIKDAFLKMKQQHSVS